MTNPPVSQSGLEVSMQHQASPCGEDSQVCLLVPWTMRPDPPPAVHLRASHGEAHGDVLVWQHMRSCCGPTAVCTHQHGCTPSPTTIVVHQPPSNLAEEGNNLGGLMALEARSAAAIKAVHAPKKHHMILTIVQQWNASQCQSNDRLGVSGFKSVANMI